MGFGGYIFLGIVAAAEHGGFGDGDAHGGGGVIEECGV